MPNFTPEGIIKIGRVPFDNSYRHTLTFATVEAQTAYFSSVCTQSLEKDSYTYVRMNNSIRVPFNAERLYTYDYVMYQNRNYGNKWFYAFIIAVNYVNENMTELVLQLDVMQTWYFDYTLVEGFVEREHVNDDTIGAHLNAEPGMDLQYIHRNFEAKQYDINDCWICLMVTQYPCYTVTSAGGVESWQFTARDSQPCVGGIYVGHMSGCKPLIYNPVDTDSMNALKKDLDEFNACGAADGIVDAYLIPKEFLPVGYLTDVEVRVHGVAPLDPDERTGTAIRPNVKTVVTSRYGHESTYTIARPFDLHNYNPRNNKLLCYPYTYLEIGDFTGRTEDYRWEYFNLNSDNEVTISERAQGVSDCQAYLIPRNYDGIVGHDGVWEPYTIKPFTYDFTTKISWVYSVYQTWLAQNAIGNNLTVLGSVASIVGGMASGVVAASGALGSGIEPYLVDFAKRTNQFDTLTEPNRPMANKAAAKAALPGVAAGAAGLGSLAANYSKMKRTPNQARGNTAGNSKFQNGYCGWYMSVVSIRREFAEIMDDFFDCYGYAIERVKVPNRTGRRNWNYVKMQNACHRGNVPSEDMATINNIYNAGITFWHTSDVGNYSLDNSIV